MAATIRILISSSGAAQVKSDVQGIGDAAKQQGGGFNALHEIAVGALRRIGEAAVNLAGTGLHAITNFFHESVSAAADFESGMNDFAAAAGDSLDAAGLKVSDFSDLFIQLGKDLPVSTSEVQEAAITLIKGGLDPMIVKGGALRDSLQFAAAAGMQLNDAAELGIKILGTFVPNTASAAEQTEFLANAQNLLVKAAGASTLDVDKLGNAMLGAAGQARAMNLDYQDFVTTMGMISPTFSSAETAGTSYKNFLVRLQPSTKPAIAAMEALGLVTEDGTNKFFDSTGKFVGNRQAAELLRNALAGLTDQERVSALQTIFGNDAMGAAVALANNGAEGYDKFANSMANAGGVTDMAAAKQQGLNFAMTNLKGTLEALQIVIGTKVLPIFTPLVTKTNDVLGAVLSATQAFFGAQGGLERLHAAIRGIITAFNQGGNGAGLMRLAISNLHDIIGPFAPLVAGVVTTFLQMQDASQKIVGALRGVFVAFHMGHDGAALMHLALENLLTAFGLTVPQADAVIGAIGRIQTTIQTIIGWLQANIPLAVQALQTAFQTVAPIIQGAFAIALPVIQGFVASVTAAFSDGGLQGVIALLIEKLSAISPTFAIIVGVVQAAIPVVETIIGTFQNLVTQSGVTTSTLGGAWQAVQGLISGAVQAILQTVQSVFGTINTYIPAVMQAIYNVISAVLGQVMTFWNAHGAEIMAFVQTTWTTISSIINLALQLILSIVIGVLQTVADFINQHGQTIQAILSGAWQVISSLITAALAVIQGVLQAALAIMQGNWQGTWAAIQSMSVTFVQAIGSAITGFLNMIAGLFGTSLSGIAQLWSHNFDAMKAYIGPTLSSISSSVSSFVSRVSGFFSSIGNAISGVIAWVHKMENALNSIHIPDWLEGHSPPPMAKWLTDIGGAAHFAGATVSGFQSAVGGGTDARNYARTFTYSPTINNHGVSSSQLDYAQARALAGV